MAKRDAVFLLVFLIILAVLPSVASHNKSFNMTFLYDIEGGEIQGIARSLSNGNMTRQDDVELTLLHDGSVMAEAESSTSINLTYDGVVLDDSYLTYGSLSTELLRIKKILNSAHGGKVEFEDELLTEEMCVSMEAEDGKEPDCDEIAFSIVTDDIHDDRIFFEFDVSPRTRRPVNVTYWVEDVEGVTKRDPFTSSNTDRKQFTPSSKKGIYLIMAELEIAGCNVTLYDDIATSFVQDGLPYEPDTPDEDEEDAEYAIDIEHVYLENHISFDDVIEVRIYMSNVDSASDSEIYVIDEDDELISERKRFRFFRGSEARFTKTVSLHDVCSRDVHGRLIIESFGEMAEREIFIRCDEIEDDSYGKKLMASPPDLRREKPEKNDVDNILPEPHGIPVRLSDKIPGRYSIFSLQDAIPGLMVFSFVSLAIFSLLKGD